MLNMNFNIEVPDPKQIEDREIQMLKKIVESKYEMQIRCHVSIKPLIPIFRFFKQIQELILGLNFLVITTYFKSTDSVLTIQKDIIIEGTIEYSPHLLCTHRLYGMDL